jgi:hypothetical protein
MHPARHYVPSLPTNHCENIQLAVVEVVVVEVVVVEVVVVEVVVE